MENKEIIHNIEPENKLIELLGYHTEEFDNSNRCIIYDEDNNEIGYIQYKKIKNKTKDLPATFAYVTEINSKDIYYNNKRKVGITDPNNLELKNDFYYEFAIKREDRDNDTLVLDLGKFPGLALWSSEYGFMNFRINLDELHLNFKSKTENFNIEETIIFKKYDRNSSFKDQYIYVISYCDKDKEITDSSDEDRTTREISAISNSGNYFNEEKILLKELSWKGGKLTKNRENLVDGTVEELAQKNKMAIDSFNHFRYLINEIVPFKKEVVSALTEGKDMSNYSMFIKDNNKSKVIAKKLQK